MSEKDKWNSVIDLIEVIALATLYIDQLSCRLQERLNPTFIRQDVAEYDALVRKISEIRVVVSYWTTDLKQYLTDIESSMERPPDYRISHILLASIKLYACPAELTFPMVANEVFKVGGHVDPEQVATLQRELNQAEQALRAYIKGLINE